MNKLISSNALTMTSQEIAELTGNRHDNVMRDIRLMLLSLHAEGGILNFEGHAYHQTRFTPAGLSWIAGRLA